MNWGAIQAIATIIGLVATSVIVALGQARTHGTVTQQVGDHGRRLDVIEPKVEDLGTRMTASEAWREGYNAGKGSR